MNAVVAGALAAALASNQFGFDLYHQLRTREEGNLVVSPASVATALAMTYAGAEGQTEEEMAEVLHFDPELPEEKLHAGNAELLAALQYHDEESGNGLVIANRLWAQQGFSFLRPFLELTQQQYEAQLGLADFARDPEAARLAINAWVEEQTAEKIEDLFPSGSLDALTRLVLVNTVYFRDQWMKPFRPENTSEAPFHVSADETVQVPLMFQEGRFLYADFPDFQALQMSYSSNRNVSMLVLLPKEADALADLEQQLSSESLDQWSGSLAARQVQVYLPRFRTEAEFSLADALAALGMPAAFDANLADFTGMSREEDLHISAVRHKTFVEVDEQGTEAAAATGVAVGVRSAPAGEPVEFRADHPFVFVIRDNMTGCILFLGRIVNPGE